MEMKTLGERLSWARRHYAKITQKQLREKMIEDYDVSMGVNYISALEIEKHVKRVSFEKVRAMACVLHVSLDFLAGMTDDPTPAQTRDYTPEYWSEEADEIAQMIDSMEPEQRVILMDLARNLSVPRVARQHKEDTIVDALDLIQRKTGKQMRDEIVRLMRSKGFPVDPTS